MREKRRILALVVILFLLIILFLVLRELNAQSEEKKEEEEQAENVLDLGQLEALSYDNGTVSVSFKKEDGSWVFEDESEVALTQTEVESLEEEVTGLTADRQLDEYDELEDYGLEEPAYTVEATDEDGNSCKILIGNQNEEYTYYMMIDGEDRIYTGGTSLVSAIQEEKSYFVENDTIPSIGSDQVKKIVLTGLEDGKKTYVADDEDDEDAISTILGGIGALSFDGCVDYNVDSDDLKDYGLNKKSRITLKVVYEDSDGEEQEFILHIGSVDDTESYRYLQVGDSKIVNEASTDTVKNLMNES